MNSFNPQNTSDETTSYRKSILYAYPGFGKTTQAKYFQDTYGPGFIISGEGGLSSIRSAGIDYLPFTSWNGETNPDKQQYAFKDIFDWIRTDEFAAKGYKWIMVDSLTELGDHAIKAAQESSKKRAEATNTKVNGFLFPRCSFLRDEKRRLKSVETESNLTNLFARMDMSDEDFNKFSKGN